MDKRDREKDDEVNEEEGRDKVGIKARMKMKSGNEGQEEICLKIENINPEWIKYIDEIFVCWKISQFNREVRTWRSQGSIYL